MLNTNRRNCKPVADWRELIERWKASGQSVAAFCAARRVSQATFYSWRKRLGDRRTTAKPPPTFAAVQVVLDPTADIVLPGGLMVRVPLGANPAAIARLVAALGGAAC
ncbi:hypothetical protein AYO44_16490 [Planctomycetaceae bacterium SCGC AG-212-F19]|nr:hypothetical protein AYO44_16490 [Planctomycetaceae bacterium SCGC AG-212-F19]